MDQTADLTTAGFARWGGSNKRERNFWIALACAAVLHASLFVGAVTSKTKRLGDENGADNAISVSLVTEADLESRSTIAEEPQPPPAHPSFRSAFAVCSRPSLKRWGVLPIPMRRYPS